MLKFQKTSELVSLRFDVFFLQSRWCDVGLREEAFTSSLRTLGQHFGSGTFQHHAVTLGLMVGSALS